MRQGTTLFCPATKGAKTKKTRGVTGSGDGWRDTRAYLTREAPRGTTQIPTYQCNKKRQLRGLTGILHLLKINATNQHNERQLSLPGCWATQQDTRENSNGMRWTNWANSNATTTKRGGCNTRGIDVGRVGGRGGSKNQGRIAIVIAVIDAKHS
jgi:hypothetical protein